MLSNCFFYSKRKNSGATPVLPKENRDQRTPKTSRTTNFQQPEYYNNNNYQLSITILSIGRFPVSGKT